MEKAMATAMAMVVVLLAAGARLSEAEVYKVGDDLGWTVMGNPNYTAWALSKTFQVGDTLVFEYDKSLHEVLVVCTSDYNACDATSPIAKYQTGEDSITLNSTGMHFFICGLPGHCARGQKFGVRVGSSSPSPSPPSGGDGDGRGGGSEGSPPPSTPAAPSGGARAVPGGIGLLLALFSIATMAGGFVGH